MSLFDDPDDTEADDRHRLSLEAAADAERDITRFWKDALKGPIGRRVIWEFLQRAGTFSAGFAVSPGGFPDSNATWFKHGQAMLGLGLYQELLRRASKDVLRMHDENDPSWVKDMRPPARE